ncbi:peptidoglycan DD-metalloendopeptidase family protein [Vallitalea pronyensis]|uniref:Peptidoglycan DD-metalloendopeptidase family protein n=1 Tax=Vallitalea pronyensis TaxID=1348613 RepID=A0A8J8SJD6_9FIRM|nr:M23 family metallopeptidase [Vallitalea pronyensis]QUI25453.1 peptidoglycan DD-metalloendopeptidase family protein [Vallitalea pronyensis]
MSFRTRKKNKEHKLSCKSYITFVIISDPTKNPITIKIPKWIRFPLLASLVAMVIWVTAVNGNVADANNQKVAATRKLQENTYENSHKDEKISQLTNEGIDKETKLQQLTESQRRLLNQLNTLQQKKEEIDSKLNNTEKTTETQPIGAIELDAIDINTKEFTAARSPILAVTSLSTVANVPVLELDFNDKADSLMEQIKNTTQMLEDETKTYAQLEEKIDEMIPYWEAYPSILPLKSTRVTSPFGWRKNPFGGRSSEYHRGVDLKASSGTSVYATGRGKVIFAGYDSIYGRLVIVDHGYGITTKYGHNSRLLVKQGDVVCRGDKIAKSGSTGRSSGPHVHYGVLINGEPQNPLNYIKK